MRRRLMVLAAAVVAAVALVGAGAGRANAQSVPPIVANAGGPYSGVVGVPITFNGTASIGVNLGFVWSFGDGTAAAGPVVSHAYAAAGLYTATLTVTDAFGQVARAATSVTVTGGAAPTNCVATAGGFACTFLPAFATTQCVNTFAGVVCGVGGLSPLCFQLGVLSPFCTGFAPAFVPGSVTLPLLAPRTCEQPGALMFPICRAINAP